MARLIMPLLLCAGFLGCTIGKVGDYPPWDNMGTAADMSQDALKHYRTCGSTTHVSIVYRDVPFDFSFQSVEKHGDDFTALSATVDIGTWAVVILCKLGVVQLAYLSQYDKDGRCTTHTAAIGVGGGLLASLWDERRFTDSGIKWGDGKSVGFGFFGYDHHAGGPVWLRLFWIPIRIPGSEG